MTRLEEGTAARIAAILVPAIMTRRERYYTVRLHVTKIHNSFILFIVLAVVACSYSGRDGA